jgi:hypothetical protein
MTFFVLMTGTEGKPRNLPDAITSAPRFSNSFASCPTFAKSPFAYVNCKLGSMHSKSATAKKSKSKVK